MMQGVAVSDVASPNRASVPAPLTRPRGQRTSTVDTVRVSIIATNPPTGDALVLEGEGISEEHALAVAKARVPQGWRTVSCRRH